VFPRQWPVKILLIHENNPYLEREEITIAADCTLLVKKDFHEKYSSGRPVFIGCPLLENPDVLIKKLAIIMNSRARRIDVVTMEVPCCQTLHMMIEKIVREQGIGDKEIKNYIVRVFTGNIEEWKPGVIDESMIELERMAHGHMVHDELKRH